jgi:hypothetical protein
MRTVSRTSPGFLVVLSTIALAAPAHGQVVVPSVPGSSNPYFSGMPGGTMCCSGDSAPAQSPVEVTGLTLTPGSALTFTVTGSVSHVGGVATLPPDGNAGDVASSPANNGIAAYSGPIDALVGVFLDASLPTSSAAPTGLNFTAGGLGTAFPTLSPALKQVFFIGDGRTGSGSGSVQTFVVPSGATRFFLGTSDGFGWFNNSGSFAVTVTGVAGGATPTPTVAPPTATPTPLAGPAANVPTLSFPMLALLGLALATAAMFLVRRP